MNDRELEEQSRGLLPCRNGRPPLIGGGQGRDPVYEDDISVLTVLICLMIVAGMTAGAFVLFWAML